MSLTSDQSEVGTRREDPLGSYLALAAEEQYDRIIISIVLTKGGMEIVKAQVLHLKRLWKNKRRLKVQAANLAMVVCFSLMIWKGLVVITGCKAPVVVVLSGAMEPSFERGELLFLTNYDDPIRAGELVVFKVQDRDVPIIHRVVTVHEKHNGSVELLTKGDNNRVDDRGLYAPGQLWLQRADLIGRVKGTLPYLGMICVILHDYPVLRYLLLGVTGYFVLASKSSSREFLAMLIILLNLVLAYV